MNNESEISTNNSTTKNKTSELYEPEIKCTRCDSLILRSKIGKFQSGPDIEMPLMFQKSQQESFKKKSEVEKISEWVSVKDMFDFENVGFTHAFEGRKFLACADCEVGPIGLELTTTTTTTNTTDAKKTYLIALNRILSME